jgi:hypothetical protein
LLADIRAIFGERGADRISSDDLATSLVAMVDRPWPEWGKVGKPITQRGIAKLLEPFKIKPNSVRIGATTPKGYLLEWFEDALRRYLPATPQHPCDSSELADMRRATEVKDAAVQTSPSSLKNQQSCGVADGGWEHRDEGAAYRFARDGSENA